MAENNSDKIVVKDIDKIFYKKCGKKYERVEALKGINPGQLSQLFQLSIVSTHNFLSLLKITQSFTIFLQQFHPFGKMSVFN